MIHMDIKTATTWTISKDNISMEVNDEDVRQLIAMSLLSDGVGDDILDSGRYYVHEVGMSRNGSVIQVTLFKEN
jgi:hypothetical protein